MSLSKRKQTKMVANLAPVEGLNDVSIGRLLPEAGGVLLLDPAGQPWPETVPSYDTEVVSQGKVKAERLDGYGTAWKSQWTLESQDGPIRYKVHEFEPEYAKSDIPVLTGTPQGVQPDGYCTDGVRQVLQAGMRAVLVGPEIGASIPQSHTAHNVQKILAGINQKGYYSTDLLALFGYSRPAMYGFGVVATAEEHDFQIVDAHFIDPNVAHPLQNTLEAAQEVGPRLAAEVLEDAKDIGRLVFDIPRALHYLRTVDISVEGARQFRNTLAPLRTGESAYLASKMPGLAHVLISFYLRSAANHRQEYETILGDGQHPNVTINTYAGAHLRPTRRRVLEKIGAYYTELANQLHELDGKSFEEITASINYTHLHRHRKAA